MIFLLHPGLNFLDEASLVHSRCMTGDERPTIHYRQLLTRGTKNERPQSNGLFCITRSHTGNGGGTVIANRPVPLRFQRICWQLHIHLHRRLMYLKMVSTVVAGRHRSRLRGDGEGNLLAPMVKRIISKQTRQQTRDEKFLFVPRRLLNGQVRGN